MLKTNFVSNVTVFFPLFYIFLSDSETTEDEGGDQYETKEDSGDVEDQAVHAGIHNVSSLHYSLFLLISINAN